jgi:SMI1-KNR4 cell-wall
MTDTELTALSEQQGVYLPDYYRSFMLDYPENLVGKKKNLGWKKESPSERQLVNDRKRLITLNSYVRLPGAPWTSDDGPWPDRYFVIGDDECGNYWCIDCSSKTEGVWFYNHELGDFELKHRSLQEFANSLLAEVDSWNRDRQP